MGPWVFLLFQGGTADGPPRCPRVGPGVQLLDLAHRRVEVLEGGLPVPGHPELGTQLHRHHPRAALGKGEVELAMKVLFCSPSTLSLLQLLIQPGQVIRKVLPGSRPGLAQVKKQVLRGLKDPVESLKGLEDGLGFLGVRFMGEAQGTSPEMTLQEGGFVGYRVILEGIPHLRIPLLEGGLLGGRGGMAREQLDFGEGGWRCCYHIDGWGRVLPIG